MSTHTKKPTVKSKHTIVKKTPFKFSSVTPNIYLFLKIRAFFLFFFVLRSNFLVSNKTENVQTNTKTTDTCKSPIFAYGSKKKCS